MADKSKKHKKQQHNTLTRKVYDREPPSPRHVELPERQSADGYQEPNLPLRRVPTVF
jgi:hypothetical protein